MAAPVTEPVGSQQPLATRREQLLWALVVFAFALAVRVALLVQLSGSALFETRMGDGRVYHLWALEIAAGDWLGDDVFYQAPLYPYFLAVVYRVLGEGLLAVRVVQVVLGSAGCALLALAGWRLFSRRAGIGAGLLLAVYAPAFFADAMIQKTVLDVFWVCLLLWLLCGIGARAGAGRALALGLALGALALTRENALAFVVVLVPWLLALALPWRRRLGLAAALLAGLALLLLPVALRNWSVGGELHLTTSQFGHNFFIGNNPAADGTYASLRFGRADPLIERQDAILLAERALGRELEPSEVSRFYTEQALEYIRSQPLDWLRLTGRKLALYLNAVELVDTEDQYTHAEASGLLRVAGRIFGFGTLAPLAAFGVAITWSRRRSLLPLYLLFLVYTASLLPFYLFARYRLSVVPILVLFAAAGPTEVAPALRRQGRRVIAAGIAAAAFVALITRWPLIDERSMRSVTHYNLANELAASDRSAQAIVHYRRAVELDGENAMATHNLGVMLARQGDLDEASQRLEAALRIAPGYAEAYVNLARVRAEQGDVAEAIRHYERGLALEPDQPPARRELAELRARAGAERAASPAGGAAD